MLQLSIKVYNMENWNSICNYFYVIRSEAVTAFGCLAYTFKTFK